MLYSTQTRHFIHCHTLPPRLDTGLHPLSLYALARFFFFTSGVLCGRLLAPCEPDLFLHQSDQIGCPLITILYHIVVCILLLEMDG